MAFKKGMKRPAKAGRKTGSQNKATKSAKQALEMAFEGLKGVEGLIEWAKLNQTDFYKLWSKIIPTTLSNDPDNPLYLDVGVPKRESRAEWLKQNTK
jgi:hypothetical protein